VPAVGSRLARLLWSWLPVLVWMALILAMSSRSDLPVRHNPQTGEVIKTTFTAAKLAHVFEYSVLALLMLRALVGAGGGLRWPMPVAIAVAVMVAALFGGLDEIRQSFVPTREPRLTDVALDTASALAASLGVAGWHSYRATRHRARRLEVERASP
jgi:VanZ family protein